MTHSSPLELEIEMPFRLKQIVTVALLLGLVSPMLAFGEDLSLSEKGIQTSAEGGLLEAAMFYLCAGVTLGCGLAICLSTNIVRMAVYLFGTLAAVALMYFLLLANFIGVIQLIVYAGGTLILLVFGVMLTSKSPWARFDVKRKELIGAGVVCTLFALMLLFVVVNAVWPLATDAAVEGSSMTQFGTGLLTTYLVPFEAISVLLLVVMIGAAYMARQE